ncbi:MAG: hypothetical protein ACLU4N_21820 [Butyricimonas faecihominis]
MLRKDRGVQETGYLPYDFDRPMLMIAEMSSLLGSRIGLKTDWYCLCLMRMLITSGWIIPCSTARFHENDDKDETHAGSG